MKAFLKGLGIFCLGIIACWFFSNYGIHKKGSEIVTVKTETKRVPVHHASALDKLPPLPPPIPKDNVRLIPSLPDESSEPQPAPTAAVVPVSAPVPVEIIPVQAAPAVESFIYIEGGNRGWNNCPPPFPWNHRGHWSGNHNRHGNHGGHHKGGGHKVRT